MIFLFFLFLTLVSACDLSCLITRDTPITYLPLNAISTIDSKWSNTNLLELVPGIIPSEQAVYMDTNSITLNDHTFLRSWFQSDFAYEMWYQPSGNINPLLLRFSAYGGSALIVQSTRDYFFMTILGVEITINYDQFLESNAWTYLAFSVTDRLLSVYLNGTLKHTVGLSDGYDYQFPVSFCESRCKFSLTQIAFYDHALTDTHISQHYDAGRGLNSIPIITEATFILRLARELPSIDQQPIVKEQLRTSIATAAQIDRERIRINSLTSGSLIVNYTIIDNGSNQINSTQAIENINNAINTNTIGLDVITDTPPTTEEEGESWMTPAIIGVGLALLFISISMCLCKCCCRKTA